MSNLINQYVDIKKQAQHLHNMILAPSGNLGITRDQMPQIDSDYRKEFEDWLEDDGVEVRVVRVPVRSLKMVQGEYNRDKVVSMIMKGSFAGLPIYISKDGYILDGNHRVIAQLNSPDASKYITAVEVGLDVRSCLDKIKSFPRVRYRKLSENISKNL